MSQDAFLDGKVILRQPEKGFRAGVDSVFLASSIFPKEGQEILDVGCGCGTLGIILLKRFLESVRIHVIGIEKIPSLLKLAAFNRSFNGLDDPLELIEEDVLDPSGVLKNKSFHHVMTNPPFFHEREQLEKEQDVFQERRLARILSSRHLSMWMDFCIKRLLSGGILTFIIPPCRLIEVMGVMEKRMGNIRIFPLWSAPGKPAKRLLIQAVKGSKAPLILLSGMALRQDQHRYTESTERILRTGQGFSWAS